MMTGERIKNIREIKNIKQQDMANLIGATQQQLSRVEKGSGGLNFDQLAKIAKSYNVNLNWLLTGEGEMFSAPQVNNDEVEEIKRTLAEFPELKEIFQLIKNKPKEKAVFRKHLLLASKHSELFEKLARLPDKKIEEKLELILKLVTH